MHNATPPTAVQPDLPGLAEAFRGVGIDNLPVGITSLTSRERTFCLEYLRTGLWMDSMRTAGYANVRKNASALRKNKGIMGFLAQASTALTEETKQIVIRTEERARGLNTLLRLEMEKPAGKRSIETIAKLNMAVVRNEALLGALKGIGKVSGVHVSGEVSHTHDIGGEVAITLPASALPALERIRRDAISPDRGQAAVARN